MQYGEVREINGTPASHHVHIKMYGLSSLQQNEMDDWNS